MIQVCFKLVTEQKLNKNFKFQGILEIKLSKKMGKDVYKFLPMTVNMPMKPKAITMDPFERNQIYIGTSQLMGMSFGEGVFAKRAIPGNVYHRDAAGFSNWGGLAVIWWA